MAVRRKSTDKSPKFNWRKLRDSVRNEAFRRAQKAGDICKMIPDARLRMLCKLGKWMAMKSYKIVRKARARKRVK